MPRKRIRIPTHIDYLSILDEKGKLDKSLEPNIPDDLLLKLYKAMVLGRRFDERLLSLQRQGRIGTFPPVKGQEAAHLGAVALLRPSDWMAPSFRETPAELWRGRTMESVIYTITALVKEAQSRRNGTIFPYLFLLPPNCSMPWGWPGPSNIGKKTMWP